MDTKDFRSASQAHESMPLCWSLEGILKPGAMEAKEEVEEPTGAEMKEEVEEPTGDAMKEDVQEPTGAERKEEVETGAERKEEVKTGAERKDGFSIFWYLQFLIVMVRRWRTGVIWCESEKLSRTFAWMTTFIITNFAILIHLSNVAHLHGPGDSEASLKTVQEEEDWGNWSLGEINSTELGPPAP